MAARQTNWLAIFSDFVRHHPKTSAAIAFNLGVVAARATKRGKRLSGMVEIPARLIELVPSVKDLGTYVPRLGKTGGTAKPKRRRAPARKPATKVPSRAPRKTASKGASKGVSKAAG